MTKFFTKEGDDYKEVDGFTQTEVDGIVSQRLERERSKYSDYDELKEKAGTVDSLKTDYETKLAEAATKATTLETELGKSKLEVSRVELIHEYKLPKESAEFLTGDTPDDLRKRAEKLAKLGTDGIHIDKDEKPKGKASDTSKLAGNLFGKKSDD